MSPPPPGTPRRPSRWPVWLPIGGLAVVVVAFLAYNWWLSREDPEGTAAPRPVVETPGAPEGADALPGVEPIDIELPGLDGSDAVVRELAARLSSHPKLAAWLASKNLVRRFVATVANVAEGANPRPHLGFLLPSEKFTAVEDSGRWIIDPRSYRRYNRIGDVFGSIDARGCARIYLTLEPLFQEAYDELGYAGRDFDRAMIDALDQVLGAPVIAGDVEVLPGVTTYTFVDPDLEALSPARKILLRAGPRNTDNIQNKLREFADLVGLADAVRS